MKDLISLADFRKLDLHVGLVVEAERLEDSERLLLLKVDLGLTRDSDESETREYLRQVVAGRGRSYDPEWLVGRQVVILANLEPKVIMGVESQGMLIAIDSTSGPVLVIPEKEVKEGSVLC